MLWNAGASREGLAETSVLGQDWVGRLSEADTPCTCTGPGCGPGRAGPLGLPCGTRVAPRTRRQLPVAPRGERLQPGAYRRTWRECGKAPCPGRLVQAQSAPSPCWTPRAAAAGPSRLPPWSLAAHPSLSPPGSLPRPVLSTPATPCRGVPGAPARGPTCLSPQGRPSAIPPPHLPARRHSPARRLRQPAVASVSPAGLQGCRTRGCWSSSTLRLLPGV